MVGVLNYTETNAERTGSPYTRVDNRKEQKIPTTLESFPKAIKDTVQKKEDHEKTDGKKMSELQNQPATFCQVQ